MGLTELVTFANVSLQMIFSPKALRVITACIECTLEVLHRDCIMLPLMATEIFGVLERMLANIAPVFPQRLEARFVRAFMPPIFRISNIRFS